MGDNIENKKLAVIREKIRKNINMDLLKINEVFNEESKKFTTDVFAVEAYLRGFESGKEKSLIDIGIKFVELFKDIEKETGVTVNEFRLLSECKKVCRD
ncbi:hypothetical protein I6U48_26575 [Clostridium sp. PL3]|uniref:Uncharacterized protein n=1 Tax=Clostridium thailandense TaxID=2794346 RepID=A0A949TQ25_9CLOT|nr:hypothetical protein [Clostridium thailandense]MBV7276450.1 hypothetical protein [Clostridium thailandense]